MIESESASPGTAAAAVPAAPPAMPPSSGGSRSSPLPPRRRKTLWLALSGLLALLLVIAIGVPVGLYSGLRSEAGSAWLMARVPGLSVVGARGPLLGDFSAQRVEWLLPGSGDRLVLEEPAWQGLQVTRSPDSRTWLAVRLQSLQALRATLTLAPRPPDPTPLAPPDSLRFPVSVQVESLSLGEFRTAALGEQPLRDVKARLALGGDGGRLHRIDRLHLGRDRLQADGELQVGSDAPFPVQARLQLANAASATTGVGNPLDAWTARVELSGPLARPALQATVRNRDGAAAPLLQADAVLLPFAAWPLAELQARTRRLDLSAFVGAAPRTALSGNAVLRSSGMDQPAVADITVDNGEAGLWNEGRLPLRSLRLAVGARPDQPQTVTLQRFDAELGSAQRPAGRLTGRGRYDNGRWTLDTALDGVAPQGLDLRAAAMRLSGQLALEGSTVPGTSIPSTSPAVGGGASGPAGARPASDMVLSARAKLTGRVERSAGPASAVGPVRTAALASASPSSSAARRSGRASKSARATARPTTTAATTTARPAATAAAAPVARSMPRVPGAAAASGPTVELAFDVGARLGPNGAIRLDLRQLEAAAGAARARADGKLLRDNDAAPWQVQARATLAEFDPQPWWAGADDSPWRRGPHRLNANASVDLSVASRGDPKTSAASRPSRAASASPDPLDAAAAGVFAALAPLRGKVDLLLQPSLLAGVAVEGNAQLQSGGDAAGPARTDASLALVAAGNRLTARVGSRADRPADDQWQFEIDAPALAALSPAAALFGMAPAAGRKSASPASRTARAAQPSAVDPTAVPVAASTTGALALSGRVAGQARLNGRWPVVRSEGQLEAQALRAGGLALQRGELRWQLGTRADAPTDLQATLSQLVVGDLSADAATVRLNGTARAHQLTLNVDSRALPPAWTAALGSPTPPSAAATLTAPAASMPAAASSATAATSANAAKAAPTVPISRTTGAPIPVPGVAPTSASLRAEGGLQFARSDASGASTLAAIGWKGRIQELTARSGANPASALGVRSREIAVDTSWAPDAPMRVALQPGRLELRAGATQAALRWNRLAWQAAASAKGSEAAGPAQIEADAELEPLAVAPLLARLQPTFGWGGDLQIGGKLLLQNTPRLKAELVLERRRGDLSVTDEIGTQVLGLSNLRLALNAADGVWSFTQAVAGTTVGVAAGAVTARTGSATAWPDASTPIEGVLELRVANLGAWGPWVPAGWRLGGALHTSATLGGRVGAPEYTGSLRGSALTVRNFAEGVNVVEGEVAIALQGTTARIDKFVARAGDGTVQLSGGASLGSAPKANLTLRADKFQLLGRVDRRIVASGQGQLQLEADKVALDGQFKVDEGLVDFTRGDAPSLSDDVVVIRPAKGTSRAAVTQQVAEEKAGVAASKLGTEAEVARKTARTPAKPPTPQRAVALNLRVNLGEQLRLRGRGLDTGLRGDLRITSPGGRLAVNGTVSTDGGTYAAYSQKLTIDRGSVIFTGSIDNPRLDIEATRPNTDVRVGVIVGGTASNPRIRLFSEPELPEVDKLSWLVLGRATDGLGRTDTALLQRAAMALLSGEGEGMTTRLTRAIGLDEVSLRQTDGEVRETVISLGKQLSSRWYVGYERGLNATAGSWQLIYRVAQRLTLRAQSGFENSLDVIWTWRWQ